MYSKEDEERLAEEYGNDPTRETVDRLAEELGVSSRSIIGKLVSMKQYKAPQRVRKDGRPVELKRDLAKEIGDMFGLELPSLAKAEREELRALRDALLVPLNLRAIITDLEDV